MLNEFSFRAMDTDVDVVLLDPPPAAAISVQLLFEQQEERFSRFRPGSLLSRLNRGEAVADAYLAHACRLALEAHRLSGGLFNPLVLDALAGAGYAETFAAIRGRVAPPPQRRPVPDRAECLRCDGEQVTLRGARLDLGGLAKGWTVDLAVDLLARQCAAGLVNAGGDLRAWGDEPGLRGWTVAVAAPGGGTAWQGQLTGALATSTTLRRRWRTAEGDAHHLIDPRTGLPAESPFVQASAWSPTAWLAEVWAKAVVIGGAAAASRARAAGIATLAFDREGRAYGEPPSA